MLVESVYPNTIPFIVVIRSKEPSWENYILLTFPTPWGKSNVSWAIYLKSAEEYTFTLFYPAITIFPLFDTAIAYKGAEKALLLVI